MYVLFVSRVEKVFVMREVVSEESYDPPNFGDVSLVDDSIGGRLDGFAEIARIAKEEGWSNYSISIEK